MDRFLLSFLVLLLSYQKPFAQTGCPEGFESGKNLILNADFENGIKDFYSDYKRSYSKDWFQGSIFVTDKPSEVHNNYRLCLDTNFKNLGKMLIVDGAEDRSKIAWQQKIKIEPNTEYYFSLFFATLLKNNPAQLDISINNVRLPKPFNYNYQHCRGSVFFTFWNSGMATEADIKIKAFTTELLGNDFVLDNLHFFSCKKKAEPVVSKPVIVLKDSIPVQFSIQDKNQQAVQAKINILAEKDSLLTHIQTDSTGKIIFLLQKNNLYVNIHAPNFFVLKDTILASEKGYKDSLLTKKYTLNPIDSGATFTLKNLTFERYSFAINETSKQDLETVIELMNENPTIHIDIQGHTDNQGDAMINYELSVERVKSVKKYLVEKGIAIERLRETGFGGTRPLVGYGSDEERKQNRRVEFVVTKIK